MIGRGCDVGIVGLGVMGRNLALNIADKGFIVAGYDIDALKVEALTREAEVRSVFSAGTLAEFVESIRRPRAVVMLVPAGDPVDSAIDGLLAHIETGDLLIDGGNSHFRDTESRAKRLGEKGILYMGVGISGGERGARTGPSIMPGGPEEGYDRVRDILEATAAHADGKPCVAYLGSGSAGTYVKMVHNGIEYGMMQLIAESYHLMKKGLVLSNDDLREIYEGWGRSELKGYLIEITARVFARKDPDTGRDLVDKILDEAQEKGTGKWTVQDAMDLRVPVPTIAAAVSMRDLSDRKGERTIAAEVLNRAERGFHEGTEGFVTSLHKAMMSAMLTVYAQGIAQLHEASDKYGYGLNLEEVARVWSGGCIIRSDLLAVIKEAYHNTPSLANVLLDPVVIQFILNGEADLRRVVSLASIYGIPAPAFAASLAYLDAFRSPWLPANLIQAQRDYFGSHRYRRTDREGLFHTEWEE
jgi:6-phosphogluconate dehydrogenase